MSIILRRDDEGRAIVPFYRPLSVFDVWDDLSREMWDSWRPFTLGDTLVPRTDIYEEKGELVMKTELPGIDKKDLDITLEGDRLTIKAEKRQETKEGNGHRSRERYYGQYLRSMTLPYPVKEGQISATLENGVLELRLPKAEEVKAKKIEVKAQLTEGETAKRERKSTKKTS